VIPDEAVEAAYLSFMQTGKGGTIRQAMHRALEAAAPYLLSHEREQTRLAHIDAMVNRDTADRLQKELDSLKAAWTEQYDAERGG